MLSMFRKKKPQSEFTASPYAVTESISNSTAKVKKPQSESTIEKNIDKAHVDLVEAKQQHAELVKRHKATSKGNEYLQKGNASLLKQHEEVINENEMLILTTQMVLAQTNLIKTGEQVYESIKVCGKMIMNDSLKNNNPDEYSNQCKAALQELQSLNITITKQLANYSLLYNRFVLESGKDATILGDHAVVTAPPIRLNAFYHHPKVVNYIEWEDTRKKQQEMPKLSFVSN